VDPDGWLHTGDLGSMDARGHLRIEGRLKELIIRGGENIYPAEIEAVLHSHPAVMDAAVFGIPSEEWGENVHAVVQLKDGQSATSDELEKLCREHLAGYKVPRSFDFRDALPRTESGKLLKRVLRDDYWKDQTTRV